MELLKRLAAIPILLLGIAISSCSASQPVDPAQNVSAKIVVTRDFGQNLILDRTVNIRAGQNAMEALQEVSTVENAYGGGFVKSINGIASQYSGGSATRQDWFFYINGLMSNTGAADYNLVNGDVEYWDFHDWSFYQFTPAITGFFPEPFLHGFRGVVRPAIVACTPDLQSAAEKLKGKFMDSGVAVTLKSTTGLTQNEKESSNIVLLGTGEDPLVAELNKNWKRLGFWAYWENGDLVVLNARGPSGTRLGAGSGLIQATQNPWNTNGINAAENVVWLITGTDMEGVKAAMDIFLNSPGELINSFALIANGDKIIRLP